MARFCEKCGAPASTGEQFCSSCGASAAPAAQPTAVQPVAVPAKSGGGAVKIILIIVAVIVGLGILAMGAIGYVGWRVSRAIHVSGPNGQMTLQTSEGKVNLNTSETYTAAELGTDPYPGATSERGGMKMDLPTGSMVTGVFTTTDSKDQVVAFYKAKFGSGASVIDSSDGAIISMNISPQESVMVTVSANSSQDKGKTRVAIVHTKNNKAN